MAYKVTAALVVARDQSGRLHHVYRGAVIPWLSDEQRAHFLRHRLIEEVSEAAVKEAGEPLPPTKPPKVAPKDDWVAWAIHSGHDPAEAESLTKQELVELFG